MTETVALFRYLPELVDRVAWARLGDWPTPIDSVIVDGRPIWIKRECDSSTRYGGNKIRTLEAWLGHARALGKRRIWAIGATGSNHAIATILHARAIGLDAGAIVFPQPESSWADENFGAMRDSGCELVKLRHVIEVPFAALAIARRDRDGIVMPPGGATPLGAFGALSAALELADQITAGLAPPPRRIVLPIGSTCTTAGLLAGFALAKSLGAWPWTLPIVHAVRVTPWPVTSRLRTAALAARTLARAGKPVPFTQLLRRLVVDGRELGGGYGRTTPRSIAAAHALADARLRIDGVYSAKAAAALLRLHRERVGPLMFWATKTATSSR
ncbi:MAG TPA: pyridoxal-phosphate dependent enzyme [Kofleriaceae bacterium]|nr:pyridoxal-phosphate dependent enzyme [Kofleriaceae bacterium]